MPSPIWCPAVLMSHMVSLFLITILVFSCCSRCESRDSITVNDSLSDSGETLVSSGSRFKLGFFTPEGNAEGNIYLGIWYSRSPTTVVWVAATPPLDSCGFLSIVDGGNVKAKCRNGTFVDITKPVRSENFNRTLQLLDSGNLVLVDGKPDPPLWQSFHEPTDTFLPGMKMIDDLKLTSWVRKGYPGSGDFTFSQDGEVYSIQNRSTVRWTTDGPGTFVKKNLLPVSVHQMLSDSNGVMDQKGRSLGELNNKTIPSINKTFFNYSNSRLMMNSSGEIQFFQLVDGSWVLGWSAPLGNCGVYKQCGSNGICSEKEEKRCQCPRGYKPASQEDWDAGTYSGGCERVSEGCRHNETFSSLLLKNVEGKMTKYDQAKKEHECRDECLRECNCMAYSFKNITVREAQTSNCYTWAESNLVFYGDGFDGELNLSLRLPPLPPTAPDLGLPSYNPVERESPKNESERRYVIAFTGLAAGIILLSCSCWILYRRYYRNSEAGPQFFSNESERHVMQENEKLIDVPSYDMQSILSATDNFSDANKLGQGGFGPVYKGRFPGGQEIAVKRLSSCSGQGIDEFLNEVVLIAKLQHRNLVRLLGYCIKGSEKMLLYEYMPNRSLDAFIFDQHNSLLLDWKKRFDIILGIARGLLYLHQDSRLRIIHRDLKTSNILLDEDMNPKISDFGLARIVQGQGTEASTNKVVGTYGYMSPEYALDGKFSIKSDVFSFGVVMLEIISGRKNTGFYDPKEVLNLLGHAWRLWCDNKALDILDPTLLETSEESQVMKCVNIGLLCVQEDPNERPPMSTVVIMLGSETHTLPLPTQPAFVVRRRISSTSSSSSAKPDSITANQLTFSMAQGR